MRVVFGMALAGLMAGTVAPARAEQWCGCFIPEARERVRCGYSSLQQCRQTLADKTGDKKSSTKGIICLPDPAKRVTGPARPVAIAAMNRHRSNDLSYSPLYFLSAD